MEDFSFVARRPRYEVPPTKQCSITVIVDEGGETFEGQLGDLSRHGMKMITSAELPTDSTVVVQGDLPTGRIQIAKSATIRWSRLQDDGQWSTGLVFDRELSWELMGEMFLSGVLSIQSINASQRPQSV
jgi:hypothetical protein